VLFELDAQVARAEAEQVNAQLQLARANLARTRELATQGFVSPAAGDTAAANVQVLEASLSLARARLEQHLVRAPFDGQVGLRNVSPGEFVKDGTDLVSFEDTASIKIEFRLPERYFGYVRTGQPIEFEVDALPGRKFAADIYIIDSEMDRDGRALLARAQAKNPGRTLASGMFARVRVSLAHRPAAVVIPEECIVPGAAGQVVFKVREVGGRTVTARVPVTVGQRSEGMVEILSGVDAGDLVATAGQMRLQGDGQNVRIVDRSARARPTAPSAAPAAGSR
jgi:membrane fusion protein (multidrug efflux system)